MRFNFRSVGAVALLGLAACGDPLSITNYGSPDVSRVLFDAASVDAAIAGLGPQLLNPQRACNLSTQAKILSEESFASVANFGMAARSANRSLVSNEVGNDLAGSNAADFQAFQRVQRLSFNPLVAFASIKAANRNTLTANQENRMRAFAYLVAGQALGYAAFIYDSVAIASEGITTDVVPGLSSYTVAGTDAVKYLDSAVTIAGRGMDALGSTYISGVTLSQAQFIALARGYRARIRAGIARTPTERGSVDWGAVRDDAAAFSAVFTGDIVISINGTTNVSAGCDASQFYVAGGWHSYPMKFIGVADTSGGYQAWSATANSSRRQFVVATPDKRWPRGVTRTEQQNGGAGSILGGALTVVPPAGQYILNRAPGLDVLIAGDGESMYDHRRYATTFANSGVAGPFTEMSKVEIDMLRAEALIRLGGAANISAAEALIDISRVRNNLPSVAGIGTAGVVPGGNACVPKMKTGTCGSLLEAMKYEKRMETAYTGYVQWLIDSRGWGDLPVNTIIEWPVPFQEMQARQQPYYNGTRVMSPTDITAATRGNYGY